jgi:hypothetical protein
MVNIAEETHDVAMDYFVICLVTRRFEVEERYLEEFVFPCIPRRLVCAHHYTIVIKLLADV